MIKLFRKKSSPVPGKKSASEKHSENAQPRKWFCKKSAPAPENGSASEKHSENAQPRKWFCKKSAPAPENESAKILAGKKKEKREYTFLLEFRCRGQLFASLESNTINNGVFKVGKSPESDLVIPETDRICSDKHLELHFSSRGIRLQAVAGNYFYFSSRKSTSVNLKLYDRVAFGDCELNVKASQNDEDAITEAHRLEFTNGEQKGKMILLDKDLIRIGSDPANDIVLKEDVISRFHAQIKIAENGECWIKDLQSINGTFVNDVKLAVQERMLMDSDEISFASVTVLFLDKKVLHTRSQIGKKFVVMGITLAFVAFLFAIFYAVTPHASQLLLVAEYCIAKENFSMAQKMLDKMPQAKEYNNFKEYHQVFNERLDRYRNTLGIWNNFKNNLQNSKWSLAVENYGMLEENNRLAWNWAEDSAEQKMNELKYAKKLLNLHFDIQNLLYSSALSLENKKEKFSEIQKIKLPDLKKEISWLLPLRKEIAENIKKLRASVELWQKAEKCLDRLADTRCNMDLLIAEMDKLYVASMGSVRARIFDVIDALKQLRENDKVIQYNRKALCQMRFSNIRQGIAFVPQDECFIDRRLLSKRSQMIAAHRKVIAVAGNIKIQYQKLYSLGVRKEKFPLDIEKILSGKMLESVIDKRSFSAGEAVLYDRFFGNRYFYWLMQESVSNNENFYSDEFLSTVKTVPLCVTLNNIFKAAETSHLYLQTLKKESLYKENIEKFAENCADILVRRKQLIEFFRKKVVQNKNKRGYFIAQMAVFYFSSPGTVAADEMKTFVAEWKKYQTEMQQYFSEYNPLDIKKMRQFKQKIQTRGIPGDPKANLFGSIK